MQSEIRTFSYPDGEVQHVHVVRFDDWARLDFLPLDYCDEALECFADIYEKYLVPGHYQDFGNMVLFYVPDDLPIPFPRATERHGEVADAYIAVAEALERDVCIVDGKPQFASATTQAFWQEMEARNCLRIFAGCLPNTKAIPVGGSTGYLTKAEPDAALKANANFFIMDMYDCATVYDRVGTPLGLCVKDGTVKNPPLFGREALLVRRDGTVHIGTPHICELGVEIGGKLYRHGENATFFSRPDLAETPPQSGTKLVIIGCRVAAVCHGETVEIPASGFVLCTQADCAVTPGEAVTYRGMEDVLFGIQVGNSIVCDGTPTMAFTSRFYDLHGGDPVPFPPSLYPLDYAGDRAGRMAIGADAQGRPMLLWAEGAGKNGYIRGQGSCGASLSEMAHICSAVGMINAVNMDGGGSAQMLLHNRRHLLISDRNLDDDTEAERPVPMGLIVR